MTKESDIDIEKTMNDDLLPKRPDEWINGSYRHPRIRSQLARGELRGIS
jgi:hypothetical protein